LDAAADGTPPRRNGLPACSFCPGSPATRS
jgi:hypothetical protein